MPATPFVRNITCPLETLAGAKFNFQGSLKRISFFDIDSRPIEKKLSSKEKKLYLREIKKDITYFGKSYRRVNLQVDISELDQDQAALKIKTAVEGFKL